MAEQSLVANLGLNISAFTQALQQAQSQFQAFAQQAATALRASTQAFTQQTTAQQASLQSTTQLSHAYLAMAQAIHTQTQAYTQAQAASLAFRQQQAAAAVATRQAAQAAQQATQSWQQMFAVAGGVGLATTLQGLIATLRGWISASVDAAVQQQSLEAAFTAIHRSATGAQQALAFVRAEAARIGIDFVGAAQAFKGLEAAARGTSLEGMKARDIFTAVSEASRVMGLTGDQTKHVLIAIEQMMSKGKVSAEELRRQMGNFLPGAFEIAARAMGRTTAELDKMLRTGTLLSEEFLPRFARQLRQELGPGLEAAAKTAAATFARLGNEVQALSVQVGNAFLKILQPMADLAERTLRAIRESSEQRGVAEDFLAKQRLTGTGVSLEELTEQEIRTFNEQAHYPKVQERILAAARERQRQARIARDLAAVDEMPGFFPPGELPFAPQAGELGKARERLTTRLEEQRAQERLFPTEGLRLKDALAEARETLRAIEKEIDAVSGQMKSLPESATAWNKELKQNLDWLNKERAAAVGAIETIETRQKAQREAEQEQRRMANERLRSDEQIHDKLLALGNDEFEVQRQQLDVLVASRRKMGADETLTAQFYAAERQKILEEEVKATVDAMDREQAERDTVNKRIAEDRMAVEQLITEMHAKETKTRVDNEKAAVDRLLEQARRRQASDEQMAELRTAGEIRVARVTSEEAAKEARKLQNAFEDLVEGIARPIQSIFEQMLSGTGNLLESLKQMFVRFLAQMAAQALATQIVIPVLVGIAGGGGAFGQIASGILGAASGTSGAGSAGASGASGAGWLGYAQQGYGMLSTGSTMLGGPSASSMLGLGSITFGDLGIGSVGASGAAGYTGAGFEAGFGTGQSGTAALAGTSIGTVASGVASGLAVALLVNELNKLVGLSGGGIKGAAGGALAGAAGGAVLGSIVPVIGTLIGAIAGAVIGAVAGGLLGGGSKDPRLKINYAQAGMAGYNADLGGLFVTQPFQLGTVQSSKIPTQGKINAVEFLNKTINTMFEQVITGFRSLSPLLQEAMTGQLNAAADELRQYLVKGPAIEGGDIKAELEKFVTKTLPNYFKDAFGKLEAAVKKLDPYVRAYEKVIDQSRQLLDNLSRSQAQAHISLAQSIVGIREGLFSPAQQFMARQRDLEAAMALLPSATPQQQLALIPQIQQLAQQVFQLGANQAVLGQDPQAVRNLQADLIRQLTGLNVNIDTSFGAMKTDVQAQLDLAQQQVHLLTGSLSNLDTIDDTLRQSLPILQGIEAALAPYGVNAQADAALHIQGSMLDVQQQQLQVLQSIHAALAGAQERQHGGVIPFNQLAFLHAGERVVPVHETPGASGTVNIYIQGNGNEHAMAEKVIREIEKRGGRLANTKIAVVH